MKKNNVKRIVACFMTVIFMVSAMTGCGNGNGGKGNKGNDGTVDVTYPLKEKVTLTIAMVEKTAMKIHADTMLDTPIMQEWMKATGVDIELDLYTDNTGLQLMYASGELPDIIYHDFSNYSGGMDAAVKDGVVLPITDYLQYAPDLKKALDNNEYWRRCATTSDNEYIGFPFIRDESYETQGYAGLLYRKDYLDAVNMPVPETTEEFYNTLVAFRDKLNIEYPFSPSKAWLFSEGLDQGILTSFAGLVNTTWHQIDGKVQYGAAQPEFKEVLTFLNKLYKEKLLDNNFSTLTYDASGANFMNDKTGVILSNTGQGTEVYDAAREGDAGFNMVGGKSLVATKGETPLSGKYDGVMPDCWAVITPSCDDIEAAVQFLNYGYTEEGARMFNYGVEGVSYEMVDGVPTFTDEIMNNPNGWSREEGKIHYTLGWSYGPFLQDKGIFQTFTKQYTLDALEAWSAHDADKYSIPSLNPVAEDLSEFTNNMADISTYVNEMTIKYIMGRESLDTFESEYLATLERLGIDRMTEIKQKAYDTFNKK